MKLKRILTMALVAASALTMTLSLTGCGGKSTGDEDTAAASYTTQEEAVQAATKESQEVVKEIDAR